MGEVANFEMEPLARGTSGWVLSCIDWKQQIIMLKTANKLVEK